MNCIVATKVKYEGPLKRMYLTSFPGNTFHIPVRHKKTTCLLASGFL